MSNFESSKNNIQPVTIHPINNVYVPLKDNETTSNTSQLKIVTNEGMRDFDIKDFVKVNQKVDQTILNKLKINNLILKDNIFSRVFIGGFSICGIYILYNLLYKKRSNVYRK